MSPWHRRFWTMEGIPPRETLYWNYDGTPTTCNQDDAGETYLDYEWAGAVAPQASIWLVSSAASDALYGAVHGLVNDPTPPNPSWPQVVTMSYGHCESQSYDQMWVNLRQQ